MNSRPRDHTTLVDVARTAARRAGSYLKKRFQNPLARVMEKDDKSFVTSRDLVAEQLLTRTILASFPDDTIISEESHETYVTHHGRRETLWILDPLDGTDNYITGLPLYSCVVLACDVHRAPKAVAIDLPSLGERVWADRFGRFGGLPRDLPPTSELQTLESARVALIPSYTHRKSELFSKVRRSLHRSSSRIVDTWCPSLDWVLLSAGRIDAVVAWWGPESEYDLKAGRFFFEIAAYRGGGGIVTTIDLQGTTILIATRSKRLNSSLRILLLESSTTHVG